MLDLPPGYVPSPLFSGFQNDASGVSFIILEAPVAEYDKMAQGFTAEELAKRGITDVAEGGARPHRPARLYARAPEVARPATYAKFFVLFRTADQTILVSVNVPAAVDRGRQRKARRTSRSVLASAKTTEKAAVRDLYSLSYLGPFKEAGTLVGTSKVYTLDGRLEPERAGETRSAFMVAPSLDKRPVDEPEEAVGGSAGQPAGIQGLQAGRAHSRSPSAGSTASRLKPRRSTPTMASRSTSIRQCCSARTAAISA